jgi:hypothetical protein
MAAQLYSNTQLAQALYEVLQELVADGKVPEELAVATLDQVKCRLHRAATHVLLSACAAVYAGAAHQSLDGILHVVHVEDAA